MSTPPVISIIVAMDRNRLIGSGGRLPWHLPADLRRFKRTTVGKPVIMGRVTWESIGKPLPGRTNIVITRDRHYSAPGCTVVSSVQEAIASAGEVEEIMIIGGADVYRQVLPFADRIYLTDVDGEFDGDTWFPEYDEAAWRIRESQDVAADDRNRFPLAFRTLERRRD